MGVRRSSAASPAVVATTPFHLQFIDGDKETSYKNLDHLSPSAQSDYINAVESGPVAVDASVVELRIFCVIFSVFVLAVSYFAVKAGVRTWKRRSADYLLTWALNNQAKQNICKCIQQSPSAASSEASPGLSPPMTEVAQDEDEAVATTGPPTTSSGVGTVDSSDASADTASTNPLLDLLSATPTTSSDQPSPREPLVTVAEIALISSTAAIHSPSDAQILRHHHHQHKRKANTTTSGGPIRKRSSNSSPPSPVFPRRRPETDGPAPDGPTVIRHHRRRRNEPFGHQHHRHPRRQSKRRVSLDATEERVQPSITNLYSLTSNGDAQFLEPINSASGSSPLVYSPGHREWHLPSRTWVDNDDDGGSLSIPLSVATAPPDYFDTMNAEWERQGYCPLYKAHRSRGTLTVPGTP